MEIIRPHVGHIQLNSSIEDIMLLIDSYYSTINNLFQTYAAEFEAVREDAKSKEMSIGYGLGMTGAIHRGCYSPSPLCDIVIGNGNRGRVAKRPGKGSCFQFGFDEFGYPVSAEHLYNGNSVSWEGIYQESDRALGLLYTVDGKTELDGISLEFYDDQNRLEEYCFSRPNANRSLTIEHYWYNGNEPSGFLLLMVSSFKDCLSSVGSLRYSIAKNMADSGQTLVRGVKCFDFHINSSVLTGYQTQLFSVLKEEPFPSNKWKCKIQPPQYFDLKKPTTISFYRRKREKPRQGDEAFVLPYKENSN